MFTGNINYIRKCHSQLITKKAAKQKSCECYTNIYSRREHLEITNDSDGYQKTFPTFSSANTKVQQKSTEIPICKIDVTSELQ